MPTYEYCCLNCSHVFDTFHSFKERPDVLCPVCEGLSKKQVTSFNLGKAVSPSRGEMEQDLRDNYGIHQTKMQEGSFSNFYQGVKKDGARVKEQLKKGEEEQEKRTAKKNAEFMRKPSDDKKIAKLQEKKAELAYKKRALTLP